MLLEVAMSATAGVNTRDKKQAKGKGRNKQKELEKFQRYRTKLKDRGLRQVAVIMPDSLANATKGKKKIGIVTGAKAASWTVWVEIGISSTIKLQAANGEERYFKMVPIPQNKYEQANGR